MRRKILFGVTVPVLLAVLASPAGARVSDGDLQRAAAELDRVRAEAGAAGEALSAGRAEAARLRTQIERLVAEVAAAEVRFAAARLAARQRVGALYVAAGAGGAAPGAAEGTAAVVRRAYAAAVGDRDREVVNALEAAAADRERLRRSVREQAREQADVSRRLEDLAAGAARALADAEAEYARVRTAWEVQEAQRRAAAAAATSTMVATTTTSGPVGTTTTGPAVPSSTTTVVPTTTTTTAPGPVEGGSFPPLVERWRPLVGAYFPPGLVDEALAVIRCESLGDPAIVNPVSGAAGLFQHMPRYFPERAAAAGFPGASPFDPEANIAAAAWLVQESLDGGLPAWYFWSCRP